MKLPVSFLEKMSALLGPEEFKDFIDSYDKERFYGLRVNTLKQSVEEFLKRSPFHLKKIPWTKDGFYYEWSDSPGKHPYYHMGLYYIQEPSAMLPATILDPKPGERVLDLCAAPGGKSVQLAASMKNSGLLVVNDISASRIKALIKNIELFGIGNCVVTNETPKNLSKNFKGYFDRILIDAPCSGEGMFRKDPDAVKSYDDFKPQKCVAMQTEILHEGDKMLKVGGILVYSTCTFNPDENEGMIQKFCELYGYEILDIHKDHGVESGRPDWVKGDLTLSRTVRIWPHRAQGEGHYAAQLRKIKSESGPSSFSSSHEAALCQKDNYEKHSPPLKQSLPLPSCNGQFLDLYRKFEKENLNIKLSGSFFSIGKHLYYLPGDVPDFRGLKISKFGLFLGEINETRNIFDPSHSLLMTLKKTKLLNSLTLKADSHHLKRYLHGETLIFDEEMTIMTEGRDIKGLVAICVDDFPVGWGKLDSNVLKNLYPKGWRMMA